MQLTGRTLILLLPTALLISASAFAGWLAGAAIAWLLIAMALIWADWRLTPAPALWTLRRTHDERLSLAVQNRIQVAVHLNGRLRVQRVWLRDEPPAPFAVDPADRVLAGWVVPGEGALFAYQVRPPRRGDYQFGDLHLRWRSPLGLVRRQAAFPARAAVRVYPNLVDIRKYDLLLRNNRLWELGLRNARIYGHGTEFERLRDYQPDDDFRRIDWKATARRGKPVSVEYETERSQNIVTLLDVGRMMRSPVGDVAKLDYAINAVLLLAYVAAQKGDKVGLLTFADSVRTWVAPRSGKVQFQRMLEQLYAVEGQAIEADYAAALGFFSLKQSRRSMAIVFTDLAGSVGTEVLAAQLGRLRRRHLTLLVTIGDPTVQRLARQPISGSSSLYQRVVAEQLLDERSLALDELRKRGVLTLDVPADELSIAVINRYLELKARALI